MELSILKGTRDYYPHEQIQRLQVIEILTRHFNLYGYQPLETPTLNYFEVMASKYAGGAEILKETYQLTDQGGRELALRYDLTVPFARFIGMNPQLPLPFKRYEIGKVFRNGPIKAGRLREFTQCDVDICGAHSLVAEAELLCMAFSVFKSLQLPVKAEINNRKLLSGMIELAAIPPAAVREVVLTLDKLKKIGADGVMAELLQKGITSDQSKTLIESLAPQGSDFTSILNFYQPYSEKHPQIKEGLSELDELIQLLNQAQIQPASVQIIPTLARGLEIYTGAVFEIFAQESAISSSLAAGGRYDQIIGAFLQSDPITAYPAVGICFGLDVIYMALEEKKSQLSSFVPAKVFIIPIHTHYQSFSLLTQLREAGIPTDIAMRDLKVKKSLAYANKIGIPYVLIVGEDELNSGQYTLRDMANSQEFKLNFTELIDHLKGLII